MVSVALGEALPPAGGGQILTVRIASGAVNHLTTVKAHRVAPAWSHSGTAIAYVRDGGLCYVRLDAEGEVSLPVVLDSVSGPLRWTPDNSSIVLTGYSAGRSDICRVSLVDSSLAVLTRFHRWAREAALLPDGRRLAYLAYNGMTYQLHIMDLDGFDSRRVTSFTVEEFGPVARSLPTTGRMP